MTQDQNVSSKHDKDENNACPALKAESLDRATLFWAVSVCSMAVLYPSMTASLEFSRLHQPRKEIENVCFYHEAF